MNKIGIESDNIRWHSSKVTLEDIEKRNKHKGCVIWLTGLSASGKSTIAIELEKFLFEQGFNSMVLDGDNVRHGLNKDLGFSQKDREENIRRLAELCKLFRSTGFIVISAFISPYIKDRNYARSLIDDSHFFEVFVDCSLEECINRDPKGFYNKAMEGLIPEFTGISAPYEKPVNPEIIIDTEKYSIQICVNMIVKQLVESDIIPSI